MKKLVTMVLLCLVGSGIFAQARDFNNPEYRLRIMVSDLAMYSKNSQEAGLYMGAGVALSLVGGGVAMFEASSRTGTPLGAILALTGGVLSIYGFGSFVNSQNDFNRVMLDYSLALDKRFRDFAEEAAE